MLQTYQITIEAVHQNNVLVASQDQTYHRLVNAAKPSTPARALPHLHPGLSLRLRYQEGPRAANKKLRSSVILPFLQSLNQTHQHPHAQVPQPRLSHRDPTNSPLRKGKTAAIPSIAGYGRPGFRSSVQRESSRRRKESSGSERNSSMKESWNWRCEQGRFLEKRVMMEKISVAGMMRSTRAGGVSLGYWILRFWTERR